MSWYYAEGGQQAGPVNDAQLEELVRAGKVLPETLVWREGMANWDIYETVFIGRYGATPGKMACKLLVVTADGGKVGYGRAAGRYLAKQLSAWLCAIGYIIAVFDSEKRALHDRICGTRVVLR